MNGLACRPSGIPLAYAAIALVWIAVRDYALVGAAGFDAGQTALDAAFLVAGAGALYFLLRARDRARLRIEERFRVVTEAYADWYWEIDADLRVTVLQGAGLERFGLVANDLIGKPTSAVENFELTGISPEEFASVRARRQPYRDVRGKVRMADGRVRHISITGEPVFSADGAFAGYRGITREITDQVETELALQASERRFRRMVEAVPQLLFFITNPARDRWIYRSPNWGAIWNYHGPLEGAGRVKEVLERILPEDRALYHGRADAESRGEVVDVEYRFRDPDRGVRWLRTRTVGVPDGEGNVEVYGVTEDVTERHQALERISASEALHRSVLESMAEGLIMRDREGRIVAANRAAERILGLPLTEMGNKQTLDVTGAPLHDDGSRFSLDEYPWTEVMRTGRPVLGAVMGLHRKDGVMVWLRINTVPRTSAAGTLEGVVATFQDITVERAAVEGLSQIASTQERRVAERTAELLKTNRELETFAHSVSHDLRAPLRAINGFARLLAEREGPRLDSESRRLLSRIEAGAGRMGELIDDVIEYSSATRREPVFSRVNMGSVAEAVATRLSQAYPSTRIEIGSLGEARADAKMMERIFEHLIGNALKFSARSAEPHVRVWADAGEGDTTVHVADNGAGFDPEHAAQLFNLFRRLHHDHEFPGTGVGLAIVRNLVERQAGQVFAKGEPGRGATFSFRLGRVDQGAIVH